MSKIFGHATPQAVAAPTAATPSAPGNAPSPATPAGATPSLVDVTAILDGLAAKNSEKLDWEKSIVDLRKLVGMDSSLSARKELATVLNHSGDQSDSAAMNIWLHKRVLKKLAENGGKVPADLLDFATFSRRCRERPPIRECLADLGGPCSDGSWTWQIECGRKSLSLIG